MQYVELLVGIDCFTARSSFLAEQNQEPPSHLICSSSDHATNEPISHPGTERSCWHFFSGIESLDRTVLDSRYAGTKTRTGVSTTRASGGSSTTSRCSGDGRKATASCGCSFGETATSLSSRDGG